MASCACPSGDMGINNHNSFLCHRRSTTVVFSARSRNNSRADGADVWRSSTSHASLVGTFRGQLFVLLFFLFGIYCNSFDFFSAVCFASKKLLFGKVTRFKKTFLPHHSNVQSLQMAYDVYYDAAHQRTKSGFGVIDHSRLAVRLFSEFDCLFLNEINIRRLSCRSRRT